jgi:ribose transport system permease protein
MVLSNNRMVYEFGPDEKTILTVGGGSVELWLPFAGTIHVPNPVVCLLIIAVAVGLAFRWSRWGRHLFAIGGNEEAANLTGVPVRRLKLSVYMFCSLCAGVAGILEVGWLGTITTSLGQGMELQVIAAAVIGGAALTGGVGTVTGAIVGAALIEIIRNSLTLLGISTFWQGTFVGCFIVVAVAFDRLRSRTANE